MTAARKRTIAKLDAMSEARGRMPMLRRRGQAGGRSPDERAQTKRDLERAIFHDMEERSRKLEALMSGFINYIYGNADEEIIRQAEGAAASAQRRLDIAVKESHKNTKAAHRRAVEMVDGAYGSIYNFAEAVGYFDYLKDLERERTRGRR